MKTNPYSAHELHPGVADRKSRSAHSTTRVGENAGNSSQITFLNH